MWLSDEKKLLYRETQADQTHNNVWFLAGNTSA